MAVETVKHWPFFLGGLIALIIIAVITFFLFSQTQRVKTQPESEVIQQVEPPEFQLRPFFSFAPRSDGKAIQISIAKIAQNLQIDYEITYKTGAGLEQGIGGPAAVEPGQSFYSREHIFGTCSKNVCTYDKGVENGRWKATIQQKNQVYELAGEWRLQNVGGKLAKLGFAERFELAIDAGTFSKSAYVITSENSSLPKQLPQGAKLISGPFTITASDTVNFQKSAQVTFFGATGSNLQILQLPIGETDWKPSETITDTAANTATAATSTFGTFILVEKI